MQFLYPFAIILADYSQTTKTPTITVVGSFLPVHSLHSKSAFHYNNLHFPFPTFLHSHLYFVSKLYPTCFCSCTCSCSCVGYLFLLNLVIYLESDADILKHCQCLNLDLSSFTFTAFSPENSLPTLLV